MRRVVLLGLVCACGPLEVPRPAVPDNALTEVVMFGVEGRVAPNLAYVADAQAETTFPAIPARDIGRVEVVFLDRPPEAYGWELGPVTMAGEPAIGVISGVHYDLDGDERWRAPASWADFVRADFGGPLACVDSGRCWNTGQCGPCLTPAVKIPVHLGVPQPSCPDDWEALEWCAPFAGDVPACAEHREVFVGDSACHPLGPPCPSGPWADGLPANTIYVRLDGGNASGSGAQDDPVDLRTALQRVAPGGTVALSDGVFTSTAELVPPPSVAIVGACPERSIVRAPWRLADDTLLTRLTVEREVVVPTGVAAEVRAAFLRGAEEALTVAGRLLLHEVSIATTGARAVHLTAGAELIADHLTVRSPGTRALGAFGAEVTLSSALFVDASLAAGAGSMVRINESASYGPNASVSIDEADVQATRLAAIGVDDLFVLRGGANLGAQGVWRVRGRGPTLFGEGTATLGDYASVESEAVDGSRAVFVDADVHAQFVVTSAAFLRPTGAVTFRNRGDLTVQELFVQGPAAGQDGIDVAGDGRTNFDRVTVFGGLRAFVSHGNTVTLSNAHLETGTSTACDDFCGGLLVRDGQLTATVLSVDVTGCPGLVVDPSGTRVTTLDVGDVTVRRRPSRVESCESGGAVETVSHGGLFLMGFRIGYPFGTGAVLRSPRGSLSQGVFDEGALGVRIESAAFPPDNVLDGVQYLTDETIQIIE